MTKKHRDCADCGEPLSANRVYFGSMHPGHGFEYCAACRENYEHCSKCGELRHLRDMRQAYCVDCRRVYDRDRWAKQRAARS